MLGNGCLVGVVRVYDEWMDMPVTKYVVYLKSDEAWTKSRLILVTNMCKNIIKNKKMDEIYRIFKNSIYRQIQSS